jgi:hypothetical protein
MLKRIANNAAAVYAEIENDELRRRISILERKLAGSPPVKGKKRTR